MKKMLKKAFTLVELLVVIAILAALATVGIISFSAYTKKANHASDNSLLSQLNHHLVLMEDQPANYTEMKESLDEEAGVQIDRISTFTKDCKYAWNIEENKLYLVDNNSTIIEPADDTSTIDAKDRYKYFVAVDSDDEVESGNYAGFSCYLKDNATISNNEVSVSASVDTGNNAVTSIKYNGDENNPKTVVIRTNSADTTVTVNALLDTVKHYGSAGVVDLQKVALTSYFEYGKVAFVELTIGRIVLTSDSNVEIINVTKKDANSYNNPIIADAGVISANMPEIVSRDQVTVTGEKTELVQIQKTNSKGTVQSSEQVYAYKNGSEDTVGTTEKTATQNSTISSTLGKIVLDSADNAGEKAYNTTTVDADGKTAKELLKDNAVFNAQIEEMEGDFWIGLCADQFAGGDGTQSNPWIITNAKELGRVSYLVNSDSSYADDYYLIQNDIDLSNKSWTPIGTAGTKFTGQIYAENTITISGLSNKYHTGADFGLVMYHSASNSNGYNDYGFIGYGNGCTIKNINFEGANICVADDKKSFTKSGIVAGELTGNCTIENVTIDSTSTLIGSDKVAAFVGCIDTTSKIVFKNCSTSAHIKAIDGSNPRAAGFIGSLAGYGYVKDIKFENCQSVGTIEGHWVSDFISHFYNSDPVTFSKNELGCCIAASTLICDETGSVGKILASTQDNYGDLVIKVEKDAFKTSINGDYLTEIENGLFGHLNLTDVSNIKFSVDGQQYSAEGFIN